MLNLFRGGNTSIPKAISTPLDAFKKRGGEYVNIYREEAVKYEIDAFLGVQVQTPDSELISALEGINLSEYGWSSETTQVAANSVKKVSGSYPKKGPSWRWSKRD